MGDLPLERQLAKNVFNGYSKYIFAPDRIKKQQFSFRKLKLIEVAKK